MRKGRVWSVLLRSFQPKTPAILVPVEFIPLAAQQDLKYIRVQHHLLTLAHGHLLALSSVLLRALLPQGLCTGSPSARTTLLPTFIQLPLHLIQPLLQCPLTTSSKMAVTATSLTQVTFYIVNSMLSAVDTELCLLPFPPTNSY